MYCVLSAVSLGFHLQLLLFVRLFNSFAFCKDHTNTETQYEENCGFSYLPNHTGSFC